MTATRHAKVRASLRDRFRRTRKPGTTPVAVDGQDVIGTAPAMPATPAIGGVDPDWERLDALREAFRRTPGAALPGISPARAAAFADAFHGHATSHPWAGAQIPDMEAPRDPYEDPGATALLSTIATPPPPFVPATARALAPRGRHGRPDIAVLGGILDGLRDEAGEPGAYLRTIPPGQETGGPASPLGGLPSYAGTGTTADGRRVAGVYLGTPDAEGRWVIDGVPAAWWDALIVAATKARDAQVSGDGTETDETPEGGAAS